RSPAARRPAAVFRPPTPAAGRPESADRSSVALSEMGGLEGPPNPPDRSSRPGEPGARLVSPNPPDRSSRRGEAAARLDAQAIWRAALAAGSVAPLVDRALERLRFGLTPPSWRHL